MIKMIQHPDREAIEKCIKRFKKEYTGKVDKDTEVDLRLSLFYTNDNGMPIDIEKLLGFPTFDFLHDTVGIINNIDRRTGVLGNFFEPRCGFVKKAA